jgi:hypothetical protein
LTYYYRVQANNVIGDTTVYLPPAVGFPNRSVDSAFTAGASATVLGTPPAAPTNLIVDGRRNPLRAELTWTDNALDEEGFNILRAEDPAFSVVTTIPVAANVTAYTDTTVLAGPTYYYKVVSFIGPSMSLPTNVVVIGPPSLPPSGLTATRGTGNQVRLDWMDNAPEVPNPPNYVVDTSYIIQIRTATTNWTQVGTIPGTQNGTGPMTFTDKTKRPPGTYFYRVQASNFFGRTPSPELMFQRQ